MSNAPSTNLRPLPTDDIHGVIPLLAKEGLGVVDRRGQDATRLARLPPLPRRGGLVQGAGRGLEARLLLGGKESDNNTKIVRTKPVYY